MNAQGCHTVLVVEDDPEIRELETFLLGAEGYCVVSLPDGEEVLERAKAEGVDLVLLDLMLPRKHGNQVLEELRNDPATSEVPVIVVSAYPKQLQNTPQVKMVLAKPFDVTDLLDAVGETVGDGAAARSGR